MSAGRAIARFKCTSGSAPVTLVLDTDGTGDTKLSFRQSDIALFAMGVDATDDAFKISGSNSLETNTRFMIDSNGDVGIGTTEPAAKFHVKATNDSSQWVSKIEADGTTQEALYVKVDGVVGTGVRFDLGTSSHVMLNNGNVGIGTDNPQNLLHVKREGTTSDDVTMALVESTVGNTQVQFIGKDTQTNAAYGWGGSGATLVFQNADTTAGNYTGFQNKNAGGYGNCGIFFLNKDQTTSTPEGEIAFYCRKSGGGFAEAGRWDEEGNLGVGVTNPAHAIDVSGTAGLTTGTAWTNTSDNRVKQNIESIDNALEKIEALRPVSFEYTQDYIDCTKGLVSGQRYNSFIAQEYSQVFPDAVSVGGDLVKELPEGESSILLEGLQQFTPHDLNMYLVRAVQELSAQVKALKEGN